MHHILPGSKLFCFVLAGAAANAGLGYLPAAAQTLDEKQVLQLQCGIYYGLLAEQADPDSADLLQAYADGFREPVETALTEAGLSETQRSDINAQYNAPIATALAEGTDPEMALDKCAGAFVDLHAVDLAVFATRPELHQQFTCGAAFLIAEASLLEDEYPDGLHASGLALIEAAYDTLTAAGVDDLGQFAITQGYAVNVSETLAPDGDGDIGFTLAECIDLFER